MKDKIRKTCRGCRNYLPRNKDKGEFCSFKCKDKFVKNYVISTIKTADSKRIQEVVKRYWKYLKEKETADLVSFAKEIFELIKSREYTYKRTEV